MKTLKFTLIISLFAFFNSCGNSSNNSESETAQEEDSSTSNVSSPCQLIAASDISNMFSVPSGIEVKMEDKALTYPTCTFKWDEKFADKMGSSSIDVELSKEVLIVLVNNANQSIFKRSTVVYKDGVAIADLGDQAIWGDKMHQLTFLAQNTLMHVNVKVSADNAVNKAKAIEIAKLIISKL